MRNLMTFGAITLLAGMMTVGCAAPGPAATPSPSATPGMEDRMTQGAHAIETVWAKQTATQAAIWQTASPTPSELPSATPTLTSTITPTPAPTEFAMPWRLPISNATPSAPLDLRGQIFVFEANDKSTGNMVLWAVNANGTGLVRLTDENLVNYGVSPASATDGPLIAIVTRTYQDQTFHDMTLSLYSLPDRKLTPIMTLLDKAPPTNEITEALAGGLAWSHDGKELAFVGTADGMTTDIYRYSLASGRIERQTDAAQSFAVKPRWSPDDQYIVYEQQDHLPEHDCCGEVWAVQANGTLQSVLLAESTGSNNNGYRGWLGDHTLRLWQFPISGETNATVRLLNAATGGNTLIKEGDFFAAYDPQHDIWLFTPRGDADCKLPASWVLRLADGSEKTLSANACGWVGWLAKAQTFYHFETEHKLITMGRDFKVVEREVPLPDYTTPIDSDDGLYWAWDSPCCISSDGGLWISKGPDDFTQIIDGTHIAWNPAWVPGEHTLFFMAEDQLYLASAPDFTPVPVSDPGLFWGDDLAGAEWIPAR